MLCAYSPPSPIVNPLPLLILSVPVVAGAAELVLIPVEELSALLTLSW